MEEYRDLFLAEAHEYLQSMSQLLLEMEKKPDNEQLTEMFRAAHSLKGMAGTMGYDLIMELTHDMESLLDKLRTGEAALGRDFVNLLFEAVDLVQILIDNLENQDHFYEEVQVLKTKLRGWEMAPAEKVPCQNTLPEELPSRENISTWNDVINEFEKETLKDALSKGEKIYQINVLLKQGSLLKSVRAYMVLKNMEKHGEVVKTIPSLQLLEEEDFDREIFLLLVGNPDLEVLRDDILGIAEIENVDILLLDGETQLNIDGALGGNSASELQAAAALESGLLMEKEESAVALMEVEREKPDEDLSGFVKNSRNAPLSSRSVEKTIRVETAKLDSLVNLVGELIINRTRVVELGKKVEDELLDGSLEQLERVTTDLQNAVMTLRMVPIRQVFDRFPRMVRDLCMEKDKDMELVISGEETELDRTLVNQVGDPLVHLLRNAVDHGLEEADERKRMGKEAQGKIFLEAHHEGSHVVVSVEDDGRGIDPEAIKTRALEKKMITKEEKEKMGPEEAIRLIFHSGFSTSKEVTDISGRGVGMDVVKTSIEALNGTVEVKSEPGKGSKFVLRLPLTLAIIRALMVESAKETYAIPIEAIRENLFVEPEDIKTIQQRKVITLRDEVLPLYCLKESLGMGEFEEQEVYPVVVVEAGDKKAGLIVDELLGQQEIVIKSLSRFINDIKGIAGATVLGDGRVTLILDVASLLEDGRV